MADGDVDHWRCRWRCRWRFIFIFIFKGVYFSFINAYKMNYRRNKGWRRRGPYITYTLGNSCIKSMKNCSSSHINLLYNAIISSRLSEARPYDPIFVGISHRIMLLVISSTNSVRPSAQDPSFFLSHRSAHSDSRVHEGPLHGVPAVLPLRRGWLVRLVIVILEVVPGRERCIFMISDDI